MLSSEFPLVSISQIRHYESKGLVHPHRSSANQRVFSAADVERLRFVMREQRDRFLPLDQIGEMLRQLDAGEVAEDGRPERMRMVSEQDNNVRPQPNMRLRIADVAETTGAAVADIEDMITAGILQTDARSGLSSHAPEIIRYVLMLVAEGYDLRQVRQIRTSAHAHAVMMANQRASRPHPQTPGAGERAIQAATADTAAVSHLYQALLSESVEVEMR